MLHSKSSVEVIVEKDVRVWPEMGLDGGRVGGLEGGRAGRGLDRRAGWVVGVLILLFFALWFSRSVNV